MFMAAKLSIIFQSNKLFRVNRPSFNRMHRKISIRSRKKAGLRFKYTHVYTCRYKLSFYHRDTHVSLSLPLYVYKHP